MPSDNKPSTSSRQLAAILFADIVGYTSMMQKGEASAMSILNRFEEVTQSVASKNQGEVIKSYGDGSLLLFPSTVNAVQCAYEMQLAFQEEPQVPLRIGIHIGEIIRKGQDIFGNGVNIASRVESMGVAGAVLISGEAQKKIKNQEGFRTVSLGSFEFKNVEEPMEVFALANEGIVVPKTEEMKGKLKAKTSSIGKWLIPALIGLVLAVFGSFYFFNENKISTPTVIDAITIFPFDIKSGSPDIQYLGNGMVDLISTKLEGIPNLNPIDPNRVFNQLKKENVEVPALEKAIEISNTLGAAEFILGSIIEVNDALQISASKYDAEGKLVARETIDGKKTELASLIDDLTRTLIADKLEQEGQELSSIAVMTSENLPALKAYLEGEQAYRNTKFRQATEFFNKAVGLDSTFALAWLRLNDSEGWNRAGTDEMYLKNAQKYAEKLPPKWQDLLKVDQNFNIGLASNEGVIANMLRKYGDNAQFMNMMAEHLFHYNPFYGRSILESKPWLQKTFELDPGNQEALRHLGDIAYMEGDTATMKEIISELPIDSPTRRRLQLYLMAWQDNVPEQEMEELAVANPGLGAAFSWPRQQVPDDPTMLLELAQRIIPFLENDRANWIVPIALATLRGQDKELIALWEKRYQTNPPGANQKYNRLVDMASIIANREFLLYEDQYNAAIDSLVDIDEPRAHFASAKYAWVLQKKKVYESNKQKLAAASQKSQEKINPARYYHWTLEAFEARQTGDNEKALIFIDSAFQYTPASGYYGEASASVMDKAFMQADIYEEQGEFDKAIQRLENLPLWSLYMETKGYATYRLTQLYEKNGDVNKALEKCDLFLRNYKDCDEKYRPWLEEVRERRQRLVAKTL